MNKEGIGFSIAIKKMSLLLKRKRQRVSEISIE